MPFPLLSLKSSAEQVCDAQGPADTQLSCCALLMLNLHGCSPWGRLFCAGGNSAAAKKFLAPFLISNKKLWEFLLEWVGMRIGTEAAKDFPL